MGVAATLAPKGLGPQDPTKKLGHQVNLLDQPLTRNLVFKNSGPEPPLIGEIVFSHIPMNVIMLWCTYMQIMMYMQIISPLLNTLSGLIFLLVLQKFSITFAFNRNNNEKNSVFQTQESIFYFFTLYTRLLHYLSALRGGPQL